MQTVTAKHRFEINDAVQANFFNGEVKARYFEGDKLMYVVKELPQLQKIGGNKMLKSRVFAENSLRRVSITHD